MSVVHPYNSRAVLALIVLVLSALACVMPYPSKIPLTTPTTVVTTPVTTPSRTPEVRTTLTTPASQTARIRLPSVNVREKPDGDPTGDYLSAGDQVQIVTCQEYWCQISEPVKGWVYRGCLDSSVNVDGLGCRAK